MSLPRLPLVTVVIPTYNRRELLAQAVASVLAQAYPRLELVIGDDGSTDGTADWVHSLGDSRVRLVSAPHTGHIGSVRNLAAGQGTGELIAFLDSDDVWLPGKLEAQVAAMRERGARWCYTGYALMDADGRPLPIRSGGYTPLSGRIVRELLTCEASAYIGTLVVERSLFESFGGFSEDRRLPFRGDHELTLRLALAADVLALPEVFTRVREHPGRSTGAVSDPFERSAMVYELFLVLNPPPGLARIARRVRAQHLADGAAHRLARGEYPAAARLIARSLAVRPGGPWLRATVAGFAQDDRGARDGRRHARVRSICRRNAWKMRSFKRLTECLERCIFGTPHEPRLRRAPDRGLTAGFGGVSLRAVA